MPQPPIKLLLIEDSDDDVFFLKRLLKNNNYSVACKKIENAEEMRNALSNESWDLIITDHTLPTFNAIEAIDILNSFNLDLPLIVLSGTIDPDIAVESMRKGARDFIMKDNTTRLIPAIERELSESKSRQLIRDSQQQQQNDLNGLMNHSPAFIYIKDVYGRYTFINNSGEKLLKLNKNQVVGMTDAELYSADCHIDLEKNDQTVLNSKQSLEIEELINIHNREYVLSSIKYPLLDSSGQIYSICGISTDITERKELQNQLLHKQKMQAIGELSGGIAHDFNNQLGVVLGYVELLSGLFSESDRHRKWLDSTSKAANRCVDLTRQLLAFSRDSGGQTSAVNINNSIYELDGMIERSITPKVKVEFILNNNLWNCEINNGELHDAILNFVINARDAMPRGGTLTIETKNVHIDNNNTSNTGSLTIGDYVHFSIKDTGTGMDKKTKDRIFEPFFTSKAHGKGTGLGLSMVFSFIKRHNGEIHVFSEPDQGTTFHLYFPRSLISAPEKIQNNDSINELPGGHETILIVDDESSLLNLADAYLTELGYKTYTANNAQQAIYLMEKTKGVDLLFSDVVMPGDKNGFELAKYTLEAYPNTKVLVTTGFTADSIAVQGTEFQHSKNNLIDKPYKKSNLAYTIRALLDE